MKKPVKTIHNILAIIPGTDKSGNENITFIWETKKKNRNKLLINPPGGKRDRNAKGRLQTVERACRLEVTQETGQRVKGPIEKLCTVDLYDQMADTMIKTTVVRCSIDNEAALSPEDPDGDVIEALRVNKDDALILLAQSHNLSKSEPLIDYLTNKECLPHYSYIVDENGLRSVPIKEKHIKSKLVLDFN
jgi:hypothetical protein